MDWFDTLKFHPRLRELSGGQKLNVIQLGNEQQMKEMWDASNPDNLGVQYTEVIPLLVAAIKEIKAELGEQPALNIREMVKRLEIKQQNLNLRFLQLLDIKALEKDG